LSYPNLPHIHFLCNESFDCNYSSTSTFGQREFLSRLWPATAGPVPSGTRQRHNTLCFTPHRVLLLSCLYGRCVQHSTHGGPRHYGHSLHPPSPIRIPKLPSYLPLQLAHPQLPSVEARVSWHISDRHSLPPKSRKSSARSFQEPTRSASVPVPYSRSTSRTRRPHSPVFSSRCDAAGLTRLSSSGTWCSARASRCNSLSTRLTSRKSLWCPGQAAAPLMGKRSAKG
jgi:hypothetical protein